MSDPQPLAHVRVVDFGQYLAGPLTAMLLADQGADIVRIEPPGGPRWHSSANLALLRNRSTETLDLKQPDGRRRAETLIDGADVVIENFRPGVMDRLGLGYDAVHLRGPALVYCSLPGFGRTDPRSTIPGWEAAILAAAGANYIPGDTAQSTPRPSPAPLASVFAALCGATAIGAALIARERDGLGQHVEVPLFDALFEAIGVRGVSMERDAPFTRSFGSGVYECADGRRVTFLANWHRHLIWLLEVAGRQDWIDQGFADFNQLCDDADAPDVLREHLIALFATRSALEWETLARSNGCSIAMLRTTEEWKALPVATNSGALVRVETSLSGSLLVPGRAVRIEDTEDPGIGAGHPNPPSSTPPAQHLPARTDRPEDPRTKSRPGAPSRSENAPAPLEGVRVLEAARVFAGPSIGKLLAQLGAEVIKLDTDPAMSTAITREPFMHEHLDRGKLTCIVDLREPDGRELLAALLPTCDVVVQNFTLGVAERLGLDDTSVRESRSDAVTVYLNAFGAVGDWATFRGLAELANVSSGLSAHVLGENLPPSGAEPVIDLPRWFATDYAAGILGAFGAVLGLYRRARHGIGASVSTSLFAATTLEQLPWIVADIDPAEGAPVTRFVRAADGWVCIAGPRMCMGTFESLDDPRTCEELERAVATAGAAAVRVITNAELMRQGGAAEARGLRIADDTKRFGEVVMPGPVIRFSRTRTRVGAFAEPFGESTERIRRSVLPA